MVKVGLDHGWCNGGTDGYGIEHHDRSSESSVARYFQADCGPICQKQVGHCFGAYRDTGEAGRATSLGYGEQGARMIGSESKYWSVISPKNFSSRFAKEKSNEHWESSMDFNLRLNPRLYFAFTDIRLVSQRA